MQSYGNYYFFTEHFQDVSVLLHVAIAHPFSLLCDIPLYGIYHTLSVLLKVDFGVVS